MASVPAKVFIKVESSAEQEETLRNMRKQLKPLQASAKDKENLTGRPKFIKTNSKSKLDAETITEKKSETIKRKKYDVKSTQTELLTSPEKKKERIAITAEDLTADGNPSEKYWELLAEKRRLALDEAFEENYYLHDRVKCLEEELDTTQKMLDEARELVKILTEIVEENPNDSGIAESEPGPSTSSAALIDSNDEYDDSD